MSLGYSVGDFVLLGQLAWTVFKSCKGAPESFADISYEVLSLHAVIKEFGDNLKEENPAPSQLASLRHVAGGCQRILDDLKVLTDRYRSLGSQNKRIRDRFKWGGEDIAGIRLRLISNTALLNAFISTSQITVQKQLQQFLNENQRSRKEGSVISSQSVSSGDSKTWRDIRRELEGFGISVAAFNTNKAFIFEWLQKAMHSAKLDSSQDCSISTPSVSSENSKLWREIRKDLEGVGVTPATFSLRKASVIQLFEQSFQKKGFQNEDDFGKDLKGVGATPATFSQGKASIIESLEQSFGTEDYLMEDDDHVEENDTDALVFDGEPFPCKDLVNEWLLRKVKNPPLEMIRHRAEMNYPTLEDFLEFEAEPYPRKDRVNEWLLQRLQNSPLEQLRHRAEMNWPTLENFSADIIHYPTLDYKPRWSLVTQHWALDEAGDLANSIGNPPGLTEDSVSKTTWSRSGLTANFPEIVKTESLPKNTRLRATKSCSAIK